MKYTISPQSRANILKLIAGLEALPDDYTSFAMGTFADHPHMAATSTPERPCGTPACIVGHGPHFGMPMRKRERRMIYNHPDSIVFYKYSYRLFIPEYQHNCWDFCFGAGWSDSTQEAIARLKIYLDHNTPADWRYSDRYAIEM